MIEIGRLAVLLRNTEALDGEGIIAAQMAQDLADSRPDVMRDTFALARRECVWLPKTAELLGLYARVLKSQLDHERDDELREEREEHARLAQQRREHPEDFFSIEDIVKDSGALAMDRPRKPAVERGVSLKPAEISACPHCGRQIPATPHDLRGMSAADLRSLADFKQQREDAISAAREKGPQ